MLSPVRFRSLSRPETADRGAAAMNLSISCARRRLPIKNGRMAVRTAATSRTLFNRRLWQGRYPRETFVICRRGGRPVRHLIILPALRILLTSVLSTLIRPLRTTLPFALFSRTTKIVPSPSMKPASQASSVFLSRDRRWFVAGPSLRTQLLYRICVLSAWGHRFINAYTCTRTPQSTTRRRFAQTGAGVAAAVGRIGGIVGPFLTPRLVCHSRDRSPRSCRAY